MDPFGNPNRYRDRYRKGMGIGHANGMFTDLRSMVIGAIENGTNREHFIDLFQQVVPTCNVDSDSDPDSDSDSDKPELHAAEGILRFNHLLAHPLFEIVPVDHQQMTIANQAYERFGKRRHPAKLNYGDLFSYALAKSRNLPLLFKGDDFSKTDIVSCL